MKQVVFAIALLAMASLTGCLNTEDSPVDENIDTTDDSTSDTTEDNSDTTDDTKDDELIEPVEEVGGHTPPTSSSIKVDYGQKGKVDCEGGYWEEYDPEGNDTYYVEEECEYTPCNAEGWQDLNNDGSTIYCDLDGHYNTGVQVIVKKVGNTVSIECIKSSNKNYCKAGDYAYVIFTSIEGLREMIECDMLEDYYDGGEWQPMFLKCEATLGFEPASFEISSSRYYFSSYDDGYDYYNNVVFRVF